MSTPTTDVPRPRTGTARRAPASPRAGLDPVRTALIELQRDLDEQMRAASATLHELRESASLTDPDMQAPLMTALHGLDAAEHASIDVADALKRLDAGTYGLCTRCDEPMPPERLELRPAGRHCVPCTR